jgi:hypothetical protein
MRMVDEKLRYAVIRQYNRVFFTVFKGGVMQLPAKAE